MTKSSHLPRARRDDHGVKVAVVRSLSELMQVTAVRAAVFMAEQSCPYNEEFDENDLCGLHLIAYVGEEPAATLRIRFFADFAKLERLAVRLEFRSTTLAFQIVREGIELCRRKGYRKIYGHAQDRLVGFWARFGARPMKNRPKIVFSDFGYTEMLLEAAPHPKAITLESDPYQIIRPEGDWDTSGLLETSAVRGVSSPLSDARIRRAS